MSEAPLRANRLPVSMHIFVRGVDASGVPFDTEVDSTNVSRGGLAFLTSIEMEMGGDLEIVVQRRAIGPREFPPLFTQGKIVRMVPADDNQFMVGVEFTGPKLTMFAHETDAL